MTAPSHQCQPMIWCPGCSREVESVCGQFNCAVGPNGLDARITEIASLKARVEEQDNLLAEAADFLNYSRGMDAMDCGAKITAYRLAQQKAARAALNGEAGK